MKAYYYLHVNGSLIYKRFRPDPSDFVKKIWEIDLEDRGTAWILCIEALALGANKKRIMQLKEQWGLTNEDAQEFANRAGLNIFMDGDKWCIVNKDFINLQESQAGFGDSALEAFADYAKQGTLTC